MKQYHTPSRVIFTLVMLLLEGCTQLSSTPVLAQTPDDTVAQPSMTPDRVPEITATQISAAPTQTPTPEPTIADCAGAKFVSPQANGTVSAGDVSIRWEPSECVMVLQYYQHEKLVDEFFDARSGTTVDIPELGSTELKIWVPGASTPSDAIWITVK